MSTPALIWLDTTSATDLRSKSFSRCSSAPPLVGFDHASMRASGRGRLPAWVVRMRCVLRCMNVLRCCAALFPDQVPHVDRPAQHAHLPARLFEYFEVLGADR